MNEELTHMELAFLDSYRMNCAVVPKERVIKFLQMERAGIDHDVIDDELSFGDYASVCDAWLIWKDAINYARSAK
jgi:hypothetical protein